MDACGHALLRLTRARHGVAEEDQGTEGPETRVEGCMGVVMMGEKIAVIEYSKEKGYFDVRGGVELVFEELDPVVLMLWMLFLVGNQNWLGRMVMPSWRLDL
ncbi:hypothetical protein C8A05DRAFT_39009 [Staphylotrichum tortipilum]|uniref:Uncharacterized protein n=1 Tax=Staphylotrichum tortipilum TaxID=2831512 RepID=A0AAN6RNR5_9PEZI|nr:hypothetical protein C8A05DRAFT_39009 [Staphylotrichum longicolle]